MKSIRVVAAMIRSVDENGTPVVFATQRGYGEYKDWWEFPGGKIESGETPKEALIREIHEELDACITDLRYLTTVEYDYPAFHLSMDCFWCSLKEGHLVLLEHEAARWLPLDNLRQVNWLPADLLVIEAMEKDVIREELFRLQDVIREELFRMQDVAYRDFQRKLIPTIAADTVIGVRTPALRQYAKKLAAQKNSQAFLEDLPHPFFDENQLHAFLISEIKDYERCMREVIRFLPFVDNWATCDQLSPKVFRKHKPELLEQIRVWLASDQTYTIRFGIGMLMQHFLDEDFDPAYPEMVSQIRSKEYYVNMMIAWYFATALAKQYERVLPYLEERKLDVWMHNKAIQKSVESYRITKEQKEYLKSLKRKA